MQEHQQSTSNPFLFGGCHARKPQPVQTKSNKRVKRQSAQLSPIPRRHGLGDLVSHNGLGSQAPPCLMEMDKWYSDGNDSESSSKAQAARVVANRMDGASS